MFIGSLGTGNTAIFSLTQNIYIVSGDAVRLEKIFANLIANAIKFTLPNGKVDVALRSLDNEIEVSVRDTGIGISKEFLPFVFDHFRQADSTATRKFSGLGIGLTIVYHFTKLHGGQVFVESEGEGKGATFRVRLPVAKE